MRKEACRQLAKAKNKDGWLITLDYRKLYSIYENMPTTENYARIVHWFGTKVHNDDVGTTRKNIIKNYQTQAWKGQLIGYKTHAHYVLEERMGGNPEKVYSFPLTNWFGKGQNCSRKGNIPSWKILLKTLDSIDLEKWVALLFWKLSKKFVQSGDEKLKPYFKWKCKLQGVLKWRKIIWPAIWRSFLW